MFVYNFAFTKIETDPQIDQLFLFLMAMIVLAGLGLIASHVIPHLIKVSKERRQSKIATDRDIRFDPKESSLYRGSRELQIPENSLEYFVCTLVFEEPNEPQLDLNVLEAAGKDPLDQRAIYQAVRRLNGKAKTALQLKGDLLKRGKEKTYLNDIERLI